MNSTPHRNQPHEFPENLPVHNSYTSNSRSPRPLQPQRTLLHTATPHPPPRHGHLTTSLAQPADILDIERIRRQWSNNLGFLTTAAQAEAITQGRVIIARRDALITGYCLWKRHHAMHPATATIVHIAVDRQHHLTGTAAELNRHLVCQHSLLDTAMLQAWCLRPLGSNGFFAHLGYTPVLAAITDNARHQPRILWRLALTTLDLYTLYTPPPTYGQLHTSINNAAKHRKYAYNGGTPSHRHQTRTSRPPASPHPLNARSANK